MTEDQEVWAIALWVESNHGKDGGAFITKQKDAVAARGDLAGVRRWQQIAAAFDQIARPTAATH